MDVYSLMFPYLHVVSLALSSALSFPPTFSLMLCKHQSDAVVYNVTFSPPDRPDPPRFPVIENIRDESVVMSWKPPLNDGGSFITAYIVEKREAPSNNWIRVASTRWGSHASSFFSFFFFYGLVVWFDGM